MVTSIKLIPISNKQRTIDFQGRKFEITLANNGKVNEEISPLDQETWDKIEKIVKDHLLTTILPSVKEYESCFKPTSERKTFIPVQFNFNTGDLYIINSNKRNKITLEDSITRQLQTVADSMKKFFDGKGIVKIEEVNTD
jgi:hypothetical protein